MARGILHDLRVVDLSAITAGGRTTQILADYGADVIKVEGPKRPDPFRHWTAVTGSRGRGDLGSTSFRVVNRNKRGLAIDLKHADSLDIMRRLVERSDLVVENFRRGVMDRLGLGFEQLAAWNPRVTMLSLSSQGSSGPEANNISFGSTLEALAGMMSVTGYDASTPTWSTNKVNYPDQIVSLMAPGIALWAVRQARLTGRGCHLDLAQRELVTWFLGDMLVDSSATAVVPEPRGNASAHTLEFCLRAQGEDAWVTVSVADDHQWQALWELVDAPAGGDQEVHRTTVLADPDLRERVQGMLDRWAGDKSPDDAAARLVETGLAAAPVRAAYEVIDEAVARGEGFAVDVPLPEGGNETQIAWPMELAPGGNPSVDRRAPHVGEHTAELLSELGYDDATISAWFEQGIVADRVLIDEE